MSIQLPDPGSKPDCIRRTSAILGPSSWANEPPVGTHPLTVFAFLWACQALVHQEFFQIWVWPPMLSGWIVTLAGVAVLLRPRSMLLFAALLTSSIVYNVLRWPLVANHILVESLCNITILAALGWTLLRRNIRPETLFELDPRTADDVYHRFSPVLRGMLVVMYFFAFVAKFNSDFLNVDVSCVSVMFKDLLHRFPFVPDTRWARYAALWGTVAIEAAIPMLLCFRRTRPAAIVIGLPFHFMLGLIGYRTFSGLAYVLYFLFVDRRFLEALGFWSEWVVRRLGAKPVRSALTAARWLVPVAIGILIAFAATDLSHAEVGPFRLYRIPWIIWILWSLAMMSVYFRCLASASGQRDLAGFAQTRPVSPGLLWAMVGLVFFNGMTQYIGLKTKTSFTMYSNLRTEGAVTNHLFVPSWLKIAGFQGDLIEVLDSEHPRLRELVEENDFLTYFEFRRLVSGIDGDFTVAYVRNGEERSFVRKDGLASDPELAQPHPALLAKLLYFRSISRDEYMGCKH